ncbi:MAG: virulence protein RhuM/Fic/DOC family protein [Saprospiraceae bacterium]
MNQIEIYLTADNETQIDVTFERDTVWLSQKLMAELFEKDTDTIGLHLKNIYSEKELDENSTTELFSVVQTEGNRKVERDIKFYNLDAILSVGYRVNSRRGTQFRQWATQRLKDYLVKGYTINQKRLAQLQTVVDIIQKSGSSAELSSAEAKGLLEIITNYTQSFILLNQYDSNILEGEPFNENITYEIDFEEAVSAIEELKTQLIQKKQASALFGNRKDESFKGLLGNIVQTFGGDYLYKSIEEQAAHLLYFVIKNHPFSDGNKRIGAFLFVWFLEKNKHRFKKNGEVKINDNGLVALALLVAQSNPDDKELMIKLIINLINSR